MAAWIKMSLGMELRLDQGDFVLDGDPVAPSPKGGRTPQIFEVKVNLSGLLNFRQLVKPCMLAAMIAAPLRGFLVS